MNEYRIIFYYSENPSEKHAFTHVIDFTIGSGYEDGIERLLFFRTYDNYHKIDIDKLSFLAIIPMKQ